MATSLITAQLSELADQWEYAVLYLAASAIISGVVINFIDHGARENVNVAQKQDIVDTTSMALFFVLVFLAARFDIGRLSVGGSLALSAKGSGSVMVLYAAVINIAGRVALGRHWSNQIEIRCDHLLVRDWPYNWSRHPLYGSMVIFGLGMGVLACNPLVIAATVMLFLPAMRNRAYHEEILLTDAFGEGYRIYQRQVPMLLPQMPEWLSMVFRGLIAGLQVWAAWTQTLDVFLFTALLTLGLSFVMVRPDFRLAYKFKPLIIILCAGLVWHFPSLFPLLWLPALASVMSLSGQCPGTLMVKAVTRRQRGEIP